MIPVTVIPLARSVPAWRTGSSVGTLFAYSKDAVDLTCKNDAKVKAGSAGWHDSCKGVLCDPEHLTDTIRSASMRPLCVLGHNRSKDTEKPGTSAGFLLVPSGIPRDALFIVREARSELRLDHTEQA